MGAHMTESVLDTWLNKECELSQRHAELLLRREAILRGTEAYYDTQEKRAASFISDFNKATERNEKLLQDLKRCQENLRQDAEELGDPKFTTLTSNYWSMVKNVFPVWQEELREYRRRHKSPRSRTPSPRPSPRPPSPSGQSVDSFTYVSALDASVDPAVATFVQPTSKPLQFTDQAPAHLRGKHSQLNPESSKPRRARSAENRKETGRNEIKRTLSFSEEINEGAADDMPFRNLRHSRMRKTGRVHADNFYSAEVTPGSRNREQRSSCRPTGEEQNIYHYSTVSPPPPNHQNKHRNELYSK